MRHVLLGATVAAALLAGLPAAAQQPGPSRLALTYVPANIYAWDLDVAVEKGFFVEEGFAPTILTAQSAPQAIQLILGKSVDLAATQPEPVIAAVARGSKELAAILQPTKRPDWYLITQPDIKSWGDLKGKNIGFSSFSVGEYWITKEILSENGLTPNDYHAILVGTSPLKLAALEKRSIAASVLFQPTATLAAHKGFHVLLKFAQAKNFPMVIYVVNRTWAAENNNGPRLSRALLRARTWLFDPKNRDEAFQIAKKYTKRDESVIADVYDLYFGGAKLYSPDGAVDLVGLSTLVATMAANGELPKGKAPASDAYLLPKSLGGVHR